MATTKEPRAITAGSSIEWEKSISDYPATSFLLSYSLVPISGGQPHKIDATPDGDNHLVELKPADTAAFGPGEYQLIGYITDIATNGQDTVVVLNPSRLTVDPAPSSNVDRRTFAEQTLEDLRQTYAKLARNSIQTATVNGRTYTRNTMAEMRGEIVYWRNEVRGEQGGKVKRIAVRF